MSGTGGVIVDGTSPTLPCWFTHLDGLVHHVTRVQLFPNDDSFLTFNMVQVCGEHPEPFTTVSVMARIRRDDREDEKENLDHFVLCPLLVCRYYRETNWFCILPSVGFRMEYHRTILVQDRGRIAYLRPNLQGADHGRPYNEGSDTIRHGLTESNPDPGDLPRHSRYIPVRPC